ncbi:hypothetical protein SAMN05421686_101125 [Thalassolituus maritimus]|uniref:Uncharacterized protein n=1 Tax=Thalassolituus maritimus TaxID=484498 RepID=A0A1N7IY68_9GAMM|nr:hypothetical protein [Thalassolituus maritimus]SIS41941.1 hypothetical protein SAMN05421686_101125 [Thalassolituus maritimus]
MTPINQSTASQALTHIKQAVAAHQIPDLSLLKSLYLERQREKKEQINALLAQQKQCIARGEAAACAMYQRHQYQANASGKAFDMNAYEHTLQPHEE